MTWAKTMPCSLVLSSPGRKITVGRTGAASGLAGKNQAGMDVPSNGISSRSMGDSERAAKRAKASIERWWLSARRGSSWCMNELHHW
jgi:hypothetical protein